MALSVAAKTTAAMEAAPAAAFVERDGAAQWVESSLASGLTTTGPGELLAALQSATATAARLQARADEARRHSLALAEAFEAAVRMSGVHWVDDPVATAEALRDGGVLPDRCVVAARVVEFVPRSETKHVHLMELRGGEAGFSCRAHVVSDLPAPPQEAAPDNLDRAAAATEAWVRALCDAATPTAPLIIDRQLRGASGAAVLSTAFGGSVLYDAVRLCDCRAVWALWCAPPCVVADPLRALADANADAACLVRMVEYTGLYFPRFGVAWRLRASVVVRFDWSKGVCHPNFREWRDRMVAELSAQLPAGNVFVHDVLAASPVVAFTVGPRSQFVQPWQSGVPSAMPVGRVSAAD